MEAFIGGLIAFTWLAMGFGTKAILRQAKNRGWDFPVTPVIWPLVLLIAAFAPAFTNESA